jgi:DNA-binding GntR family transcriptional regulator
MAASTTGISHGELVKQHLAAALKQAIMSGRLAPGQRVIEGKWATEFGTAQASVREAINLLISEGFLVKKAGRSARVVSYREQDVPRIYEVRGALEGLAGRLATESGADLAGMEAAYQKMKRAAAACDMTALIESDLQFHIALAEASGNPVLIDSLRRILSPLFAFILTRVLQSAQGPDAWAGDLPRHRQMIDVIREGNGALAQVYVQHCIGRFGVAAYRVWENIGGSVEAHVKGDRRLKAKR